MEKNLYIFFKYWCHSSDNFVVMCVGLCMKVNCVVINVLCMSVAPILNFIYLYFHHTVIFNMKSYSGLKSTHYTKRSDD